MVVDDRRLALATAVLPWTSLALLRRQLAECLRGNGSSTRLVPNSANPVSGNSTAVNVETRAAGTNVLGAIR